MKKPARPSIEFPTYTKESSATAVDESPWFAAKSARDEEDEATVTIARPAPKAATPTRTAPIPAAQKPPQKPAPRPSTDLSRRVNLSSAPAPKATAPAPARQPIPVPIPIPAPITMPLAVVKAAPSASPVAPAPAPSLAPAAAPAPAWNLPALPAAAPAVPERKELPSFGPVALDVEEGGARSAATVVVARPRRSFASWLAAALAVVLGIVGGRELLDKDAARAAASRVDSSPIPSVPMTAPPVQSTSPSGGHRLTPEKLFPAAPARAAKPAKLSAAEYQREKARLAADLAQRNAPVFAPSFDPRFPSRRMAPPTLDETLRSPRMRGEHD